MLKIAILLSIFVVLFASVESLPNFIRGRLFNNKLKQHELEKFSQIDAQWYEQRLDHFNEATKTTWKQV